MAKRPDWAMKSWTAKLTLLFWTIDIYIFSVNTCGLFSSVPRKWNRQYRLTFCAHVFFPVDIVQLMDVKNPRTNSFCICVYMFQLCKWPTAYSYFWTLSKINMLLYKKMTSNHPSLSPFPSVPTLHFSLASIHLGHQPIYLPDIDCCCFYYSLFWLFPSDCLYCCCCFFLSLFSLGFLLCLIYS